MIWIMIGNALLVFQLINQTDPKSFIAVDDMKDVKRGYMHVTK